jgi:hypothetical protein
MAGWLLFQIVYLLMCWLFGLVLSGDHAKDAELFVLGNENQVLGRRLSTRPQAGPRRSGSSGGTAPGARVTNIVWWHRFPAPTRTRGWPEIGSHTYKEALSSLLKGNA